LDETPVTNEPLWFTLESRKLKHEAFSFVSRSLRLMNNSPKPSFESIRLKHQPPGFGCYPLRLNCQQ